MKCGNMLTIDDDLECCTVILLLQLLVENYLKVNTWKFTQTHKHLCLGCLGVGWGRAHK